MAISDVNAVIGVNGGNDIRFVTTSDAISQWQTTEDVNANAGLIVRTLPAVSSGNKGQSIEIKKTDQSVNAVRIIPASGQTLDGQTNTGGIYLFNQNDAIVIRSNGISGSIIVSDNRSSVGQSKSYARIVRTTPQTINLNVGNGIVFTNITESRGTGISLDAVSGQITLKGGREWLIRGNPNYTQNNNGGGCTIGYGIRDITNNVMIGSVKGILSPVFSAWDGQSSGDAEAIIPARPYDTVIRLEIREPLNFVGKIGNDGVNSHNLADAARLMPYIFIEELSIQANVINTVDSVYATSPTGIGQLGTNDAVLFSSVDGNIPYNPVNGRFSLIAGKEYEFDAAMFAFGVRDHRWWNATTNLAVPTSNFSAVTGGTDQPLAAGKIQPKENVDIYLKCTQGASVITYSSAFSYARIRQVGSTAQTVQSLKIPLAPVTIAAYQPSSGASGWGSVAFTVNFNTIYPNSTIKIDGAFSTYVSSIGSYFYSARVDGTQRTVPQKYFNIPSNHEYIPLIFTVANLAAGAHTLTVVLTNTNQSTDNGDFINLILTEYPQ